MTPPSANETSAAPRVLIIDDDRALCVLIRDYLAPFGYAVSAAHPGPAGVEMAVAEPWHAIILDVMLPGLNGFEVLKQIRRQRDVPVIMLTARGEEEDQIVGLELGADDYLPKGSSSRQLLARLHAITRRAALAAQPGAAPSAEIVIAELRINLLLSLARAKGRVKTREALLDVQVSALRKKASRAISGA